MFGKKVLSIIGTLFVASRLAYADNTLTTTCSPLSSTGNGDCTVFSHYCIKDDEIYGIGESCDSVKLGAGIHVFEVTTAESSVTEIDLTDSSATVSNEEKLAIYVCNEDEKCYISAGYIKVGASRFYKVTTEDSDEIDGLASSLTNSVSCSSENVGTLVTNGSGVKVCLSNEKYVDMPSTDVTETYLLGGDLGTGSAFEDLNTSTYTLSGIALTTGQGALVFNSALNVEYYCNDSDNLKLTDRLTNMCEGTDCNGYYTCEKGVCDKMVNDCTRGNAGEVITNECNPSKLTGTGCSTDGYYLQTGEGVVVTEHEIGGTLYSCNSGTCEVVGAGSPPNGLYFNSADLTGASNPAPYISCETNVCTSISISKTTCGNGAGNTVAKDGEIFKAELAENYSICLDNSAETGVSLLLDGSLSSSTPFFMSVATAGNIFDKSTGTSTYVIVNVTEKSVQLDSTAGSVLYKYADATYKIIDRDAANNSGTGVCKKGGNIIEFVLLCTGDSDYDANAIYYSKGETKTITIA